VYHCRAADDEVQIRLTLPEGANGTVRVYVIDPDNFQGGRRQTVAVGQGSLGKIEAFQQGRWLERRVTDHETDDGKLLIKATNARQGSNAVISIIEWVEETKGE
jgi:hypothetical protein